MLFLGSLELNPGTPRVAVGFSEVPDQACVERFRRDGVDIAEVRLDQFKSLEHDHITSTLTLFRDALPTIATIRISDEGGGWRDTEEARQRLFEVILPYVDAVDVELRATDTLNKLRGKVKKSGKLLVVSHHDYATTPDRDSLQAIVRSAKETGADIIKIATLIKDDKHIRDLASLLVSRDEDNMIVIGMGSAGTATRVLFPALGSLVTFAFASDFRTAPGQLAFDQMYDMLRVLYPKYNEETISKRELLEAV